MKKLILSILFMSTAHAASGDDIYSYKSWATGYIKNYAAEIDASPASTLPNNEDLNKCQPLYKNIMNNKVLDIRYALGYFDDSQGIEIVSAGKNWGYSPSLDRGIYNGIRSVLTESCTQRSQVHLCGFEEIGDSRSGKVLLTKHIELRGEDIEVRIHLTQASASESYIDNQNSLKERQDFLTRQSEENYFGGIGKADVVIYNGHSRNGGGPDFNPPVLDKNLHTDYKGYYEIQRTGIKRVLELVKARTNEESILAFFSCYSKKHFYADLSETNPGQRMIFSSDTINYNDSLKVSMGYIEGLMRGACGQELADIAKQGDKIKNGFIGFNLK